MESADRQSDELLKNLKGSPKISNEKKRRTPPTSWPIWTARRKQVCDIIEVGLAVLPEKIQTAKTASEVTTAIGTLIDKWALVKSEGEEGKVQVIIDV